ncbi:MAG: zinc ribbon domain-containing protein [Muribaculaceae bacterium]
MDETKCPECGENVSVNEEVCPHCGSELHNRIQNNGSKAGFVIVGIAGVFVIILTVILVLIKKNM